MTHNKCYLMSSLHCICQQDISYLTPNKQRRGGSEKGYIRFGKRRATASASASIVPSGGNSGYFSKRGSPAPLPCTIQFLRQLPNKEARVEHVQACSINRSTRNAEPSGQDRYIRYILSPNMLFFLWKVKIISLRVMGSISYHVRYKSPRFV